MNKTKFTTAIAGAVLAAATLLVPVAGQAADGYRSGTAVTVGYRDYDRRGRYDDGYRHYDRHHHHRPPYGRAYGYYAPRYPAPSYYRPYYPSYYAPAPRYYYGPDSGWSVDLHYFFRD